MNVVNVIYTGIFRAKAVDEECVPCIVVTQEVNGFAIWENNTSSCVPLFYGFFRSRDEAIEFAVSRANVHRERFKEPKRS